MAEGRAETVWACRQAREVGAAGPARAPVGAGARAAQRAGAGQAALGGSWYWRRCRDRGEAAAVQAVEGEPAAERARAEVGGWADRAPAEEGGRR